MCRYEAHLFDIKWKRLLEQLEKYDVVDLGLRYAMQGGRGFDGGYVLENVVYLERRRMIAPTHTMTVVTPTAIAH